MKYFTKEWYKLSQHISLHSGLKATQLAANYDELTYNKLYEKREKAYIKLQEELYNTPPSSVFFPNSDTVPLEQIMDLSHIPDEHKIVIYPSEEHITSFLQQQKQFENRAPFDVEKVKKEFRDIHYVQIQYIQAQLPHSILSQIADIRVFALEYCTKRIYNQLKKQSIANERELQSIRQRAIPELTAQHIPEHIHNNLHFHDCTVLNISRGEDVHITFDSRGGFTSNNSIKLINAEILIEDEGLLNSRWLYDELYRTDNYYELHVLLVNEKLIDFIVRCSDIEVTKSK